MTDTLVIRICGPNLPEQDDLPASWLVVDDSGRALGSVQSGLLAEAAGFVAGRRVVVLVPGVDVLLAEPELPVRGGARLAQVIPFALEEHLSEDVEQLHFAVGKRAERPGTPVAVVSIQKLDAWLARLRALSIEPDALYSDAALLPVNPAHTILLIEKDRLYIRHPDSQPFVLEAEPLDAALELSGIYPLETEAPKKHVIAYAASEDDWRKHQAVLDAARDRLADLKVQLLPNGALSLMSQNLTDAAPINILQGAYATRSRLGDSWKRWRIAAILLGSLIALNLIAKGVELWRLGKVEKTLDAAIEQTFREAMPGEQNAANARRRMQARLDEIHRGGGSGDGSLLKVLNTIGTAVSQVPDTTLDAFNFRGAVFDMKVQAKDVGSLGRLQSLVNQNGLTAELQGSNARPNGVEGLIQIKTPATNPRSTTGHGR